MTERNTQKQQGQPVPEFNVIPAEELLEALKAQSEIEAEPHTLTRLMNAHIAELAKDYGVLYRSGKRTAKGRPVYLKDIREELEADVANVGNDTILDTSAGAENSCISYTTATVSSEGA